MNLTRTNTLYTKILLLIRVECGMEEKYASVKRMLTGRKEVLDEQKWPNYSIKL